MKVLIVSDTHKSNANYFRVLELEAPDMVIHCGDAEGCEYAMTEAADCPVHIVLGNNDFFSELPRELMLEIEDHLVWVLHGHNYYVSMGTERLYAEAVARGADIVCYGHTHRPNLEEEEEVTMLNPGSLSYPRQEGRRPSYCVMDLCEGEDPVFTFKYL